MIENTPVIHIEKDKENDTYKIYHPTALTRGQKLAAAGLAFFAFFTVVVWSLQLKNSISNPFMIADSADLKTDSTEANVDSADGGVNRDTDGDGLSDYDEINQHHTSPYLEDSDSDGILDKAEIDSGFDPNCSEKHGCLEDVVDSATVSDDVVSLEKSTEANQAEMLETLKQIKALQEGSAVVSGNSNGTSSVTSMEDVLGGKATPNALRAMLKTAGMDETSLGKLSDDDLMEVYQEMIQ